MSDDAPDLCLYHANCMDGFGAAWAVRKRFGEQRTEYLPVQYGSPPPDVSDKHVVIVDFSYPRQTLVKMAMIANSVTVLDHHKTAMEDLAGFPEPLTPWSRKVALAPLVEFDMDRSGAIMAWNYFHPEEPPPTLLRFIQDRDLWLFHMKGSREIHAALSSYPFDFAMWDTFTLSSLPTTLLRDEGVAILRAHDKQVAELTRATSRMMNIGGYVVPVANLPFSMASDAGHLMSKDAYFAATYSDTAEGRLFSLRSQGEHGADVSAIAKRYGGGGHKNAAGFKADIGWEGEPKA